MLFARVMNNKMTDDAYVQHFTKQYFYKTSK